MTKLLRGQHAKGEQDGLKESFFFLTSSPWEEVAFPHDWSHSLLQLCLSWVPSVGLVNEASPPAYVHSCPDAVSGYVEAAGC